MELPNTFEITVTKEHLDKAIVALQTDNSRLSEHCLIAQALHEKFPKNFDNIGYTSCVIKEGGGRIPRLYETMNTKVDYITHLDSNQLMVKRNEIASELPFTAEFKRM